MQNSNIRNILTKLLIFFKIVSMFNFDESGLSMFKNNDKIYTLNNENELVFYSIYHSVCPMCKLC